MAIFLICMWLLRKKQATQNTHFRCHYRKVVITLNAHPAQIAHTDQFNRNPEKPSKRRWTNEAAGWKKRSSLHSWPLHQPASSLLFLARRMPIVMLCGERSLIWEILTGWVGNVSPTVCGTCWNTLHSLYGGPHQGWAWVVIKWTSGFACMDPKVFCPKLLQHFMLVIQCPISVFLRTIICLDLSV